MAAAEIPFEYIYTALEATRGTAVTPPTRNLGMAGTLTPMQAWNRPNDARGTLEEAYRQNLVREWAEFEASSDVDLNTIHHLFAGAIKGGVSASLVETGVQSWVFTPNITADDLKSYTMYWGDPNMKIWQGAYGMIDEIKISAKGSGTEGITNSITGKTQKVVGVTSPSSIAVGTQLSLPPSRMDFYMDTSTFGSTSITSRILDVEVTIPTAIKQKFGPVGAAGSGGNTFRRIGRDKRTLAMHITMELLDTTQFDLFLAGTAQKFRWQANTEALIGTTQRGFLRIDTYGNLSNLKWADLEGVNRVVEFDIMPLYESGLGASFVATVQNSTTTA